ncbi:MAG: SDR family oxidoreductase [Planctomycetes bacterium]|nr:SDR family oxidoreductase [Planctomycetota bacterium]
MTVNLQLTPREFEDKIVVITGGSAGLGLQIASAYAKSGATLHIIDINPTDAAAEYIKGLGAKASFYQCDITKEKEVVDAIKQVSAKAEGKIDVLVNNAAINGIYQLFKDMPLEGWKRTLDVNLTGPMMVTRECIPLLIANGSGAIVNISSNCGKRGLPIRGDYVCSKWALIGMTQTLAYELVDDKIRVNAVCPGPIEGDRIEQVMEMHQEIEGVEHKKIREDWEAAAPMKRFVTPQEVSNQVLFLSSTYSSCMTGQTMNATGGFIMD